MTRGQTCSHFPPVCTQIQAHALCSAGVWLPLIGWVVDIHPHARSLNVVPVDHWERLVTMLSGRRLNMMRMSQAEVKYENRMENVSPASLLDRLSDYWWKLNWQFALSALTAVLLLWPKAHPVTLFLFLLRFSFHSLSILLHHLSSLCLWLCPLNCPLCYFLLSLRSLIIIQFNTIYLTMFYYWHYLTFFPLSYT